MNDWNVRDVSGVSGKTGMSGMSGKTGMPGMSGKTGMPGVSLEHMDVFLKDLLVFYA